jgi:hypothetical protein
MQLHCARWKRAGGCNVPKISHFGGITKDTGLSVDVVCIEVVLGVIEEESTVIRRILSKLEMVDDDKRRWMEVGDCGSILELFRQDSRKIPGDMVLPSR